MFSTRRLKQLNRIARMWVPLLVILGIVWSSAPTWRWDRQPAPAQVPTMEIVTVREDRWVIVRIRDFPAGTELNATMGPIWTRGVGGHAVGTLTAPNLEYGYYFFRIPAELHGHSRIAIRLQSAHARPYFAFNWFYNRDSI